MCRLSSHPRRRRNVVVDLLLFGHDAIAVLLAPPDDGLHDLLVEAAVGAALIGARDLPVEKDALLVQRLEFGDVLGELGAVDLVS